MLTPDHGPADNQAPNRGQAEQVNEGLTLRPDTCGRHPLTQPIAVERALIGQRLLDHREPAFRRSRRYSLLR